MSRAPGRAIWTTGLVGGALCTFGWAAFGLKPFFGPLSPAGANWPSGLAPLTALFFLAALCVLAGTICQAVAFFGLRRILGCPAVMGGVGATIPAALVALAIVATPLFLTLSDGSMPPAGLRVMSVVGATTSGLAFVLPGAALVWGHRRFPASRSAAMGGGVLLLVAPVFILARAAAYATDAPADLLEVMDGAFCGTAALAYGLFSHTMRRGRARAQEPHENEGAKS